jgi:hypothetical protein
MATFNNISLLPIVLTCFALLVQTGISYNVQAPSETPSEAPSPLSWYQKYLNNCARRVYPPCGDEIFFSIFVGNQTASNECCFNLVNEVGKQCHDDMTKFIVASRAYKESSSILERSGKVWDNCVSSLLNIPPSAAIEPEVFNFNSVDPNVFNFHADPNVFNFH